MEAGAWHAGDAGRERDEGADHGQEASDEDGEVSPAGEEAVGPVELAVSHEDPASIALDEGTSAVAADFVSDERAEVASDRTGGGRPEELERALEDEIARKGHDEFGRQRDTGGLDGHQDCDPRVAGDGDDLADKDEEDGEDAFSHRDSSVGSSQFSVKARKHWDFAENCEMRTSIQCIGNSSAIGDG